MNLHSGYIAQVGRSTFISVKALTVDAVKFGPPFRRVLAGLETSQWFSREQLEELQLRKLRALLQHAYTHVPYYHRLFDSIKLTPDDIRTLADLKQLPLLEKSTVRNSPEDFVSRKSRRWNTFPGWTTGTTGAPLNALRSRESIAGENAMIWRQRRLAGLKFRCRKAAIWGTIWENVIVPAQRRNPPFWRYNVTDNQLLLSYYHMSDSTLPAYVRHLESFAPELIEGFPSTLLVLARHLKKVNRVIPVKAIFTSSEVLYDVHRRELEEAFSAKVFDLYGQAERVVAATECEHHSGLHINPEYGILEILKDGKDAPPGSMGEVVGTGFNNYAMPLIRYRAGDLTTLAKNPCPCGRQMPLLEKMEGRKADVIRTPDGRVIPGNGLMGGLHGVANIKRSQIVQERLDHVVVNIQKEDPAQPVDVARLRENLAQCLGTSVTIDVCTTDDLDKAGRNKFRWVVSHLPVGQ